MSKHWRIQSREKKVYTLTGHITTQMRFAVIGSKERFLKHKHAYKVWRTLKEFGCKVYPIAEELKRLEGAKIYEDLHKIPEEIDVVVPCLRSEYLSSLVEQCKEKGVHTIWFQEGNWNSELQAKCDEVDIQVVKGCVLKHRIYSKPFGFINPCYWHGLRESKVPRRKK